MFKRCVNGQEGEWRIDVRERENDGEWTVQKKLNRPVCDVQILQKSVQHAVASENRFPRVTADQITGPQRNDYELVEQILALRRVERKVVSERIAEQQRQQSDRSGDSDRT